MKIAPADLPDYLLLVGALAHAAREGGPSGWSAREWWRVLAPLSSRRRRAVVLVVVRGMKLKDVARLYEVRRQAVGNWLRDAKAVIRELNPPGTLPA